MAILFAIPILSLLTVFQSAVVSRVPLLQGNPDLVLLVLIAWALQERVRHALPWSLIGGLCIGFVSIIPISIPILSYVVITGFVRLIRQRLWENPILAMFATTFLGSIIHQSIIGIYLSIGGTSLPIFESLRLIILPSLILNLIFAAPIYAVVKDLAEWVYPEEIII
jgi:rod shape-determining protein MreD